MPNCIKSCHDCEQNLRRAYVGRSPLTTDMLFTCLKCKAIGLSALRILADANKTASDLQAMLGLGLRGRNNGAWSVPVICTSVETDEGVENLSAAIDGHSDHLSNSGERDRRQHEIAEMRVLKIVESMVRQRVEGQREASLKTMFDAITSRRLDPHTAACKLLQDLKLVL